MPCFSKLHLQVNYHAEGRVGAGAGGGGAEVKRFCMCVCVSIINIAKSGLI